MQAESGQVHVFRNLGTVQRRQDSPDLATKRCTDLLFVSALIESLQAPMTKVFDHNATWYVTLWVSSFRKRGRAVTVSRNWRITFSFDGEDAVEIDLEDYHGD
jgi:plasmid maintenance system killer protein